MKIVQVWNEKVWMFDCHFVSDEKQDFHRLNSYLKFMEVDFYWSGAYSEEEKQLYVSYLKTGVDTDPEIRKYKYSILVYSRSSPDYLEDNCELELKYVQDFLKLYGITKHEVII